MRREYSPFLCATPLLFHLLAKPRLQGGRKEGSRAMSE